RRGACPRLAGIMTDTAPAPPGQKRCDSPQDESRCEGPNVMLGDQPCKTEGEGDHSDAAECGAHGIERRRVSSPPCPFQPGLALPPDLMLLDQGDARAEDRGKRQKQATYRGTCFFADQAGQDCGQAAQGEADDIFVPAPVLQR